MGQGESSPAGTIPALTEINQMITNVKKIQNENSCDDECKRKRKINETQTNLDEAKRVKTSANQNLLDAEEAYYLALPPPNGGAGYYSDILEARYTKEAQDEVNKLNSEIINPALTTIENLIKTYKSQNTYKSSMDDVYYTYSDQLRDHKNKVENTIGKKNVNKRLGSFYDYNTSVVNSFIWYMKNFVRVLFVISIIILIYKKQYKNTKYYVFYLALIILPYLLSLFYTFIMSKFRYVVINNFYFIFVITILAIIGLFQIIIPFKEQTT